MNHHPFRFAAICIVACTIIVLILYAFADKPNEKLNGFKRIIRHEALIPEKSINVQYSGYYFAGSTDRYVYLGNYTAALHMLRIDQRTMDTAIFNLRVDSTEKAIWKYMRLMVDYPKMYIAEGISPSLFQGNVDSLYLTRFAEKSCYFTHALNIAPATFLVRGANNSVYRLLKLQTDTPYIIPYPGLLIPQSEGLFSTDGTIIKDKITGKIVYVYQYRNEFICLDSCLESLYTGHTIDTNTIAKIQVATITEQNKRMFKAPAVHVNRTAYAYNDRLYIISALLADNEPRNESKKHNVMDVYSLSSGIYLYSSYIPKIDHKNTEAILITGNTLYAIAENHLSQYKMNALQQ
ncbi:hypothetical protein ACDQ55_02975 [Chitinophaga sp. 30R24]|uniref:hypothetical protein n=1 Tax=Chitinophaga sp. 30R24 TaxID=3248838 RepID=UPI003B8FA90D